MGIHASLLFLLAAPAAFAMNWQDFRRSTRIEDHRPETNIAPDEQKRLVQYGQAAKAAQFPFLCPGLKAVAPQAAELGQELGKAKTLLDLYNAYLAEMNAYGTFQQVASQANSCAGAKTALLQVIDSMEQTIRKHRGLLQQGHEKPDQLAGQTLSRLKSATASPSLGDKINNAISRCPQLTKGYQELVSAYRS